MELLSLPAGLSPMAFSVAEAARLGLTPGCLRSGLYLPTRGVHSVSPPVTLIERARIFAKAAPDGFAFSHQSAAALLGMPLSYAMEHDDRLHIMTTTQWGRMRREGVRAHRGLETREVVFVEGVPVVSAPDTWVDFGELVGRGKPAGLDDLIIAGDVAANIVDGTQALREALARRVRPRGKVTLSYARHRIRLGSASAMETRARLMVVRAGLPEPQLNVHVVSTTGQWLACCDLVWRKQRVVGEYNGVEWHEGVEKEELDGIRREGLERDGWTVVDIVAADVFDPLSRQAKLFELADALDHDVRALRLVDAEPQFYAPAQFQRPRRAR
ncbi:MAG: hypothetical protein L0H96_21865 [Humibacillus sp.]|nr:hypothetical protein [Humibacillus sp.]MDN5779544.1 hypothetical protein [Humibacillus sp.]